MVVFDESKWSQEATDILDEDGNSVSSLSLVKKLNHNTGITFALAIAFIATNCLKAYETQQKFFANKKKLNDAWFFVDVITVVLSLAVSLMILSQDNSVAEVNE